MNALMIFLVAYLPFALSGAYPPSMHGTMGRVNGMGAWAWAAALGLLWARGGEAGKLVCGVILAISMASAHRLGSGWIDAARQQRRILSTVVELHQQGKREFHIPQMWERRSGAPIFEAGWDWAYAVRYVTKDEDAKGKFIGQ